MALAMAIAGKMCPPVPPPAIRKASLNPSKGGKLEFEFFILVSLFSVVCLIIFYC